MNRVPEFRVWSHSLGKFLHSGEREWYLTLSGKLCFLDLDCISEDYLIECNEDLYVTQQYTGLNAKNKQKVFEGDILRCFWKNGFQFDYQVYWLDRTASFEIVAVKDYEYPDDFNEPTLSWFYLCHLEVVGNIFENKNLLK